MIYYTGDIHGDVSRIADYCEKNELTKDDVIILLGDVGVNFYCFYGDFKRDSKRKGILNSLGPTMLCVHGNHEKRPQNIPTYTTKEWNGGTVLYEPEYPNILFPKDGEIFDIEGIKHLVIGGAYSVDKEYRLLRGCGWWADEQPSDEIKAYVEEQVAKKEVDVIVSHTCPYKYEPTEMFLGGIDQSKVDKSTELWLDKIEESVRYKAWYCGHWHTNKRVDKMHFLFECFEKKMTL